MITIMMIMNDNNHDDTDNDNNHDDNDNDNNHDDNDSNHDTNDNDNNHYEASAQSSWAFNGLQ